MKTKDITVLDNGGKTIDRYTVIAGAEVFGLSDNPTSPQGFNQWLCNVNDLDIVKTTSHSKEVSFESLSPQVKGAIERRIYAY